MKSLRGTVTVLDRDTGEIRVEASVGLGEAGSGAHYRLGEGITGRVVETGKPIVVPQVSREADVSEPGRAAKGSRQAGHHVRLRAVLRQQQARRRTWRGSDVRAERDYEADSSCLRIVASMMAQAVKADHFSMMKDSAFSTRTRTFAVNSRNATNLPTSSAPPVR